MDPRNTADRTRSSPAAGNTPACRVQRPADTRDWRELWRPALHLALMRSAERRSRVLKHPDLAELLTRPEVGYARPEQWTGYVPPEMWNDSRNNSPRRAALVAIATEAMNREKPAAMIEAQRAGET